ncbi:hypothetical protein GeomeDRAFT_1879 [Geobacter metallireducens RCH3]|uniref:DUF4140 domain-containing protein n=1 Tax=Geobacter metallireducens (strain ATCC 53774 / DSM 7210 / GS-15) TaxID=269799 RepID=Q39T38_GEOMG|nr:hypothetical protein [Geobacter metallireducens]ABB32586.1 hypothetical protein Gmet_2361 [Geobacter metallireducens GS-15]EHP86387.1 hypothetical protein GeomeDRAFT_1879 [Geobacter metallireducens RCH3]
MRFLIVAVMLFVVVSPAVAASKNVTYFLDGTRVEGVASAPKGYLELPLPGNYIPGSFRVRPAGSVPVARVDVVPARPDSKAEKEMKDLMERRRTLEDRLKALDVRQEIFKAAAKSQSSKAPRKTKNNPQPLDTIRKGTDYAVTQLEEVYRGRRRAEEGLKTVDARIEALKKEGGIGGSVARVWLSGKGSASYSFLTTGTGWTPFYDFRLRGNGMVEVTVKAQLPGVQRDKVSVVAQNVVDATPDVQAVSVSSNLAPVARFSLPVEREEPFRAPQSGVSFAFRNTTGERLMAGGGACYLNGEYLGAVRFEGSSSGELKDVVAGRLQE